MDDKINIGLTIIVPGLDFFKSGAVIDNDLDPDRIIAVLSDMVRDICKRAKAETKL